MRGRTTHNPSKPLWSHDVGRVGSQAVSDIRPRLVINFATGDLDAFAEAAEASLALSDRYLLRMVVNHLPAPDTRHRTDLSDPYLQYSANFPDLFHLVVPAALAPYVDDQMVQTNLRLAQSKLEVLRQRGIGGAFLGREPVYAPEGLFQEHPTWRGPRIDHPSRSRNPKFAPCFHHPEVQTLYREAFTVLGQELPGLDTFYWWTNDSGAGFCWYDGLYCGPNGPADCRELGPIPAMAAFHSAVLDGLRASGAADPMSITTQTQAWDDSQMPPDTYRYPSAESPHKVDSVHADVSLTYPVRYVWDPVHRLDQLSTIHDHDSVAIIWWLSDVYHRTSTDMGSIKRQVALWDLSTRDPAAMTRSSGRLSLLRGFAEAEYGAPAADDVVEGWLSLHEAFVRQYSSPFPKTFTTYLLTYGAVSHRWLTRPMVAFPEELTKDEEGYYLPHVFALGDGARRNLLLDVHGYPAALPGEAHDLRSTYFDQIASPLTVAGHRFARAAKAAGPEACEELAAMATAAQLLASMWRSCRNWIEFAVLRSVGVERTPEEVLRLDNAARNDAAAYHRLLHGVMRDELDNATTFQSLLGTDPGGVVVRGAEADDEDTFTLAPDLQAQLTRRRDIMVAHWQDTARLVPVAETKPKD
jgi:hypothetical protein